MDVLDRVREFGADAALSDAQLADALDRVRRGWEPDAAARRAKRVWIGAGGALAAAAATIAVVVAISAPRAALVEAVTPSPTAPEAATPTPGVPDVVVTAPPPPTAPVQIVGAAAVLERAAELAPLADPSLEPGQFLQIVRDIRYVVTHGEPVDGSSEFGVPRENADSAWIVSGRYVEYMPADRSAEWVRVFEPEISVLEYFGADAPFYAEQWLAMVQRSEPIIERYQGGLDYPPEDGGPVYASDAYFAQMPRDPQDLLAWQRARIGAETPEEEAEALVILLIQDLELNAAPADLRATMFRALSLLEGVEIQSVAGGVTTLAFRFDAAGERSATMSIDDQTGLVVSSTSTRQSAPSVVPEGIPDNRVATSISVVDSAP